MISFLKTARTQLARRRLLAQPGVSVDPSARIRFDAFDWRAPFTLEVGAGSILECSIAFEREGASFRVGRDTYVGPSVFACSERITIGNDVLISWGCTVVDHDSHSLEWRHRQGDVKAWYRGQKDWTHVPRKPVTIRDKVWMGFNVSVLKGVTIGEGAVVGACSVVTKDVEPWTLVVGHPARVVRKLEPGERPSDAFSR